MYNSVLINTLDKHAPTEKRIITLRPVAAWYNDDINQEKWKEESWNARATRLTVDRQKQLHIWS